MCIKKRLGRRGKGDKTEEYVEYVMGATCQQNKCSLVRVR